MDNKQQYWKGLDELHRTPEFEQHRYNEFAEKLPTSKIIKEDEFALTSNRRDFLKFMGFGITAATLTACTQAPIKNAVPYAIKPAEVDPGIPDYYATTCYGCDANCSLLVKTRDGRPIKIEGNPDSQVFRGGVCAVGQGTVLSLYDLGRLSNPTKRGPEIKEEEHNFFQQNEISWAELDKSVRNALAQGGNIRILTGTINSPSTLNLIDKFISKHPGTKHIQYDASSSVSALRQAHEAGFGKSVVPGYKFEEAKTVVSFTADFLGTWISPVEYMRQYANARKAERGKEMLQHFQIESTLSLTGSNADYRATASPSQMGSALVKLHNLIAAKAGAAQAGSSNLELAGNILTHAANALWNSRGRSIVVCGVNDLNLQTITAAINNMLGNYGTTIDLDNHSMQKMGDDRAMNLLVEEMNAGSINTLITWNCNPVYTYPKAFDHAMRKVPFSVSLNDRVDETSIYATYIAPDHHFLESWNDSQPKSNYYSLTQPTISPIFNTRAAGESLMVWMGENGTYEDHIKNTWKNQFGGEMSSTSFPEFWINTLEKGFIDAGNKMITPRAFNGNILAAAGSVTAGRAGTKENPEIVLYEKVTMRDGREANNPWLQETPDPISKVCWDNYAAINPKMADELGVEDEDIIEINSNGHKVELPVLRQVGQKYGTIAIAVGYGRGEDLPREAMRVAYRVGKNAFHFATITPEGILYSAATSTVRKTGGKGELAMTQTHHHMEGRDLVRETDTTELVEGKFAEEMREIRKEDAHMKISLWKDYRFPGHHWGMAVDLNACTGCNACVVACIAENNTPVVGKDEVRRRREMHWMRIDRYFSIAEQGVKHEVTGHDHTLEDGYQNEYKTIDKMAAEGHINYESVRVMYQPLMCQHCENAPCESVCPVNAISHSSEGLNQQAYNRCVGTRYCANNCPFKVRRFNWFNYALNEKFQDYTMQNNLGRMVLNPDVTIRTRGVMEKCTFCVQRIQIGKLNAKKDGRSLQDGEIKTACQQTCPANAIVFGDMNDPNSELSKLMHNQRNYRLLNEINVRPVVSYLAKVRNLETQA